MTLSIAAPARHPYRLARVSFLGENQRLLHGIWCMVDEIRSTASGSVGERIPTLQSSWLPSFELTWAELCRQQGWPLEPRPTTVLARAGRWALGLAQQRVGGSQLNHAGALGFDVESPVFANGDPYFAVPPELTEYPTAYGFRMCTSGTDMWQPLATGHYSTELVETGLLLRLSDEVTAFVDVGANVGFYSLLMASAGLRVLACEPSSANLRALRKAVELNGFGDRVTVLAAAVGSEQGELELHLCALGSGGHSVVPVPTLDMLEETEWVPVITLEGVRRDHGARLDRAAVKIDVEGFELAVIHGGSDWLRSEQAPILIVEAWPVSVTYPEDNHLRVVATLSELGYRVYRIASGPGNRAALDPIGNPKRFEPASGGNYLALPRWALGLEERLALPVDARVLVDPARLRALHRFLEHTLESLQRAVCRATP